METVIQLCFRLKQAVGSHALMVGSGFEHLDSMQAAGPAPPRPTSPDLSRVPADLR